MAISTNGAIITRVTSALYGEYLSNASYTEVKDTAPATVAANFLSNDFAGKTDLQVANTILTNLGLTSITGLNNWLSAQLTAAGSTAAAKGAKLVSILNDYANLTSDATYGSSLLRSMLKLPLAWFSHKLLVLKVVHLLLLMQLQLQTQL